MILPEKVFPAARELEERFPALRAEIDALLEKRTIPAYGAFDPVRAAQVSEEWKLYYAYMYGQSNELARDEVPTLLSFAQSRPEVVNAFVSILDPGVELPPHKDPYAGVLRYHLGVRVPRENPPHIRLDQDRHTWKEGEGRVLDVSVEHEVVNTSEEPRVVVIIDFRRPMGFFASALNRYMLRLKRKWAPQFVEASRYDVMHAA
ncbi:aspartyl/asparaginyl beta-hydroxylase domain-containing protein [Streptomyces albus]|nr:aspartyl/asparaginyl beta-hydroxylase domain-containing protein [Streptomyces albus]